VTRVDALSTEPGAEANPVDVGISPIPAHHSISPTLISLYALLKLEWRRDSTRKSLVAQLYLAFVFPETSSALYFCGISGYERCHLSNQLDLSSTMAKVCFALDF
jgi:hypothetical protein